MQSLQRPTAYVPVIDGTKPQSTSTDKSSKSFSGSLKLEEADALFRATGQYQKWQKIRQNNGTLAIRLAEITLERHALSQNAAQGQTIDLVRFDQLTSELARHELFLTDHRSVNNTNADSAQQLTDLPLVPPAVSRTSPPITTQSLPGQSKISADNLLLLDVQINKTVVRSSMIGYGSNGSYMLPLGEVCKALDLAIDVAPNRERATGWFISENRKFSLDLKNGTIEIEGRTSPLIPGTIEADQDDIFVDSKTLGQWFPAEFKVDFSKLSVHVETREKFPIQERIAREELRSRLDGRGDLPKPRLPYAESDYELFSVPFVDVSNYNSLLKRDGKSAFETMNTIRAKGDLGFMSSDLFISGDQDDPLANVTFTLERYDPKGNLLGPLHATLFSLGDITTTQLPFIDSGLGQGVSLSNKDLAYSSEFDTTRFDGDLPPGWEIEIYRNNTLVAGGFIGSSGHYSFDNIPLYFGENKFEIISYGPQGQKTVEEKIINVGAEMLQKGKSRYEASLSAQDTITGQDTKTIETGNDYRGKTSDTARVAATYEYGLSKNMSLSGGVASLEIDKLRRNYVDAGIQGSYFGMFGAVDIVQDDTGGSATELLLQSSLGPMQVRAKQDFFADFSTPDLYSLDNPAKSNSDISLSGSPLKIGPLPSISYSGSFQNTEREKSRETSLSGQLSTRVNDTYIANTIVSRYDSTLGQPASIDGNVNLSKWLGPFSLRGNVQYDIKPEHGITQYDVTAGYNLSPGLIVQADLSKTVDIDPQTVGSLSLNWTTDSMIISPKISYDSDNNLSAFLALNFSLGQEPRTGKIHVSPNSQADTGSVSAMVFHDKNNNQIFDGDDERLPGVDVKATQLRKSEQTDENGIAYLDRLTKFQETDVEIDPNTLEDPYWVPTFQGNSINLRPGEVRNFEFPVVTSGEIDGTVIKDEKGAATRPLANQELFLVDKNGKEIQRTRSEYDGFYLFEKILPGEYMVQTLDTKTGKGQPLDGGNAYVTIGNDGTVISGHDVIVSDMETGSAPKPSLVQRQPEQGVPPVFAEPTTADNTEAIKLQKESTPNAVTRTEPKNSSKVLPANEKAEKTTPISPPSTLATRETETLSGQPMQEAQRTLPAEDIVHRTRLVSPGPVIHKQRPAIITPDNGAVQVKLVSRPSEAKSPPTAPLPRNQHGPSKRKPAPPPPINTGRSASGDSVRYGVQLASFRSIEKASSALNFFQKKLDKVAHSKSLSIVKADLGPGKGVWYRVIAPGLSTRNQAVALKQALAHNNDDGTVIHSGGEAEYELHLASFRTGEDAAVGIKRIQKAQGDLLTGRDLAITRVDLGPGKGVWFRVLAQGFRQQNEALTLSKQLQLRRQYSNVLKK